MKNPTKDEIAAINRMPEVINAYLKDPNEPEFEVGNRSRSTPSFALYVTLLEELPLMPETMADRYYKAYEMTMGEKTTWRECLAYLKRAIKAFQKDPSKDNYHRVIFHINLSYGIIFG